MLSLGNLDRPASATQLTLDVRVTGDGVTALHGMLTGGRRAPRQARRRPVVSPSGDVRL